MNPLRLALACAPWLVLLPAAFFALLQCSVANGCGLPIDDAWIHAAYARSFAEGMPFRLHAESPIAPGSSAPLWSALLGALHALLGEGSDPHTRGVVAAWVLGLVSAVAAAYAFRALLRRTGVSERVTLLALAAFALQPRWVWGTLSGLEVSLYTALVLGALARHARAKAHGRPSQLALALAALAGWARPECFVLVPLLVLDAWLLPARRTAADDPLAAAGAGERRACTWTAIGLAAAIVAAYLGLHLALYERPLPTTFYVKAEAGAPAEALAAGDAGLALRRALAQAWRQWSAGMAFFPAQVLPWAPFLLLGMARVLGRARRETSAVLAIALLFPLLQGAVKFVHPENQVGRYFWHQAPLWILLAAAGLQALLEGRPASRTRPLALLAGVLALGAACAFGVRELLARAGVGSAEVLATARFLLWNDLDVDAATLASSQTFYAATSGACALGIVGLALVGPLVLFTLGPRGRRGLVGASVVLLGVLLGLGTWKIGSLGARNVRETEAVSVAAGRWIDAHTAPEVLIACHDLGCIAYFGKRRVLDLQGIGSPRVLALPRGPDGRRVLAPLLLEERPEYFAGFLEWHYLDLRATAEAGAWAELPLPGHEAEFLAERTKAEFLLPSTVTLGGTDFRIFSIPWR